MHPPTPPDPGGSPEPAAGRLDEIRSRAVRGTAAMGARQILGKSLDAAGWVLLSRIFDAEAWGTFGIVSYAVTLLSQASAVGLGAALVRMTREPGERETRTVFTIQLLVAALACAGLWGAAPALAGHYGLGGDAAALFRALGGAILLMSLRTIPSIRLERALAFDRLAAAEVVETAVYWGCALPLAWAGWGIWSLVVAVLARGAVAVAVLHAIAPWRPGFAWDRAAARDLLRFGIPYQGSSMVSAVAEGFVPLAIGTLCGPAAVGLVNWSRQLVNYPTILLWPLEKILFPVFARLQGDPAAAGRAVEKAVRVNALLALPIQMALLALAPRVIEVGFGRQWLPALPMVTVFLLANLHVGPTMPVGNAINALGQSGFWMRICLFWSLVPWAVGIPAVRLWGPIGYAWVMVALAATIAWPVVRLRRLIPYSMVRGAGAPLAAACGAAAATAAADRFLPGTGPAGLAAGAALFGATYLTLLTLLAGRSLRGDLRDLRQSWSTRARPAAP